MEGKKIFDFSLLRRVFSFAAPYKKKFYISLALAIILAVLAPVRPLLIQYTINQIIQQGLINTLNLITVIQVVILFGETALPF